MGASLSSSMSACSSDLAPFPAPEREIPFTCLGAETPAGAWAGAETRGAVKVSGRDSEVYAAVRRRRVLRDANQVN